MSYSKKDYEQVAEILRRHRTFGSPTRTLEYMRGVRDATSSIALALAQMFSADNDRFDTEKFLDAALVPRPSTVAPEAYDPFTTTRELL